MKEQCYENLLNIKTLYSNDIESESIHYNGYEPTSYEDLNNFFIEYELKSTDSIIDFGSGKGRLNFYLNYQFKCRVIGIEMNEEFHNQALLNKEHYLEKYDIDEGKVKFLCVLAEEYKIKEEDNKFYFFNPFSVDIFMKVIDNILGSVYQFKRDVEIILFYPADEYVFFLEQYTLFTEVKEVRLKDYKYDKRERFVVYKMGFYEDGRVEEN